MKDVGMPVFIFVFVFVHILIRTCIGRWEIINVWFVDTVQISFDRLMLCYSIRYILFNRFVYIEKYCLIWCYFDFVCAYASIFYYIHFSTIIRIVLSLQSSDGGDDGTEILICSQQCHLFGLCKFSSVFIQIFGALLFVLLYSIFFFFDYVSFPSFA